jgi:hypothetical protein
VVMTGYGADGADGIVAVKRAGGTALTQDEETSEVYGMPWVAVATGVVDRVLPLGEIAAELVGLVGSMRDTPDPGRMDGDARFTLPAPGPELPPSGRAQTGRAP